jgi:ABC-type phosphate/phosphonate transport system substrate-binding protein
MNRRTAIAMFLAAILPLGSFAAEKARFKVGVLSISFVNVDVRDGRAAIDVWMKKISASIGLEYTSELFSTHESLVDALKAGDVDALYVTPYEYLNLLRETPLVPMVAAGAGKSNLETYVMLAKSDAPGGKDLAQFRGKRAVVHTAARGRMPIEWMETELVAAGFTGSMEFLGRVEEAQKPQPAILRVYFGEADLCLVPRSAFEMACELNPQLGRKISIIRESPAVPAGLLVKRANYSSGKDQQIIDTAVRMNETVEGRQVLTLLQLQRMKVFAAWGRRVV